jgi:hypothetical protein
MHRRGRRRRRKGKVFCSTNNNNNNQIRLQEEKSNKQCEGKFIHSLAPNHRSGWQPFFVSSWAAYCVLCVCLRQSNFRSFIVPNCLCIYLRTTTGFRSPDSASLLLLLFGENGKSIYIYIFPIH